MDVVELQDAVSEVVKETGECSVEQMDVLYLDKCVQTAAAFGLDTHPDQWERVDVGVYAIGMGGRDFLFHHETGLAFHDGDKYIEVHVAEEMP